MITYFMIKIMNLKRNGKPYKTLTSNLESVETVVIIGGTTTSVTFSVTGVGFVLVPISSGFAYALSIGKKVIHRLIINKYKSTKNNIEKINKQ